MVDDVNTERPAPAGLELRRAKLPDSDMVLGWRNDPWIAARGASQQPISAAEHQRWFKQTVGGSERRLFIVELDGTPIGQVRFDRAGAGLVTISVYLLREHVGRGLGVMAIRAGCDFVIREWGVDRIEALIRSDNPGSMAAFERAGFIRVGETSAGDNPLIRWRRA